MSFEHDLWLRWFDNRSIISYPRFAECWSKISLQIAMRHLFIFSSLFSIKRWISQCYEDFRVIYNVAINSQLDLNPVFSGCRNQRRDWSQQLEILLSNLDVDGFLKNQFILRTWLDYSLMNSGYLGWIWTLVNNFRSF